jgi:hypothetical protein
VRKLDAPAQLEQPAVLCRACCREIDPERPCGPVQQDRVAEGLGGGREDEQLCVGREQLQAPDVALLDPASDRLTPGKTESAGQADDVPRARQLEQSQRIAVTLHDDLVANSGIQGTGHIGQQQRASIAVPEAPDGKLREPGEHRRERVALRNGQPAELVQHRRAQLVQAGISQLHLRLDADGPRDVPAGDPVGQVTQQRALLPAPASPRRTVTRLWPASASAKSRSSASHSLRRPRSSEGGRGSWLVGGLPAPSYDCLPPVPAERTSATGPPEPREPRDRPRVLLAVSIAFSDKTESQ